MTSPQQRILISACLAGEPVRYDGRPVPCDHPVLARWRTEGRLLSFCPETAAGLPVPRPPAEIEPGGNGDAVLAGHARVYERDGAEVSAAFVNGAMAAVEAAVTAGISIAVLKEGSPSCGSGAIADGRFAGGRIAGQGVTTAALRAAGVWVFSEQQLDAADACLRQREQTTNTERDRDEWMLSYGRDLTADEIAQLQLSESDIEQIDAQLMGNACTRWRKVAMIIGMAMMALEEQGKRRIGVPDLYYAMRLRTLVADGKLESQGDLYRMRFSEVRLPAGTT